MKAWSSRDCGNATIAIMTKMTQKASILMSATVVPPTYYSVKTLNGPQAVGFVMGC